MSDFDDKTLKREDELTDISEIPAVQQGLYAPKKPSLFGKLKEGVSDLGHKITHSHENQENVQPQSHDNLFTKLNEGLSSIASGIASTLHLGGHEGQPLGEKASQEIEGAKVGMMNLGKKLSHNLEEYRDSGDLTTETTITPNREGPSVLDKINDEYGKVADKVAGILYSNVAGSESQDNDTNLSQRGEGSEPSLTSTELRESLSKTLEAPTHQINPAELNEFHEVKSGFQESVDEFKHETRIHELGGQEELTSNNPFEALSKGEEETSEESGSRIRTIGGDITNKANQVKTNEPESKSIAQVVKEGITETAATLSNTLNKVAENAFQQLENPLDKENVTA